MPAYRNRPLYIDLDKAWKRRDLDERQFYTIGSHAGYVLKTHIPIEVPNAPRDSRILELLDSALVLTVRRESEAIVQSMARWLQTDEALVADGVLADRDAFDAFWQNRSHMTLEFNDLFKADRMKAVLDQLGVLTETAPTRHYIAPPAAAMPSRILAHKTLTRLLGRHAPRIDTTIHTLK